MDEQLHKLARLVQPESPALAAQIAEASGTTLEALGVGRAASPPPQSPSLPPRPHPRWLVDTVVCVAAEQAHLPAEEVRPILRAVFERARLAELSVEDMCEGLSEARPDEMELPLPKPVILASKRAKKTS